MMLRDLEELIASGGGREVIYIPEA